MNCLQSFPGALRAPVLRNALAAPADMAGARQPATYVDPSGREWMRLDETFASAGSVPSPRVPARSRIVTKHAYSDRHNSYTNRVVAAPPKNVVLNTTAGAVRATRKTDSGLYRFTYRVCELADPRTATTRS
jgi:hypothetical protein